MSLVLGLCCGTDGQDDQQALADLGQSLVRVALTKDHSDVPLSHRLKQRRVVGVVAAETFGAFGLDILDAGSHRHGLTLVYQRWGPLCDWIEIGNEPDDPGASSSGMPPKTWENLLAAACQAMHAGGNHDTPRLISGGLSTGQPSYLDGISIPPCMWLGLHAYNLRLCGWPSAVWGFGDLNVYIDAYRAVWGGLRGVALSEWGVTQDDPEFASTYIRRFLALIRERREVALAAWFSLSDTQSVVRHGLLRADGTRKPQFSTYAKEITMPEFKLGFKAYADAHPKIGKPLADEYYLTPDVSVQPAEGGLLMYSKVTNSIVCLPSGEPGK